ncbi:ATP-dependent helicase [Azospirillum brasilense]|nr:ATP-dependent helicase [Azospirillum brasilense]
MRTFGKIALATDAKAWEVTEVEPHVAIRMKQVFPRIPKWETKLFSIPNTPIICADLDWFLSRYPLRITAEDRSALTAGRQRHERTSADMETILLPDWQPPAYLGLREGSALRPYQSQAIEVAYRRKALLLGDVGGLGKTYTAAGFLVRRMTLPAAVVVQVHLQTQWLEKLGQFTTLRCHAIRGTKPYNLPPADVYVFRYSQLSGWADIFAQGIFRTVVYDEIQELRTGVESAKGCAALVLSEHVQWRIGLTGTPIYNWGREIYAVARFLDPEVLGSAEDFFREWTSEGRLKDAKALGTYLRENHFYLRRTKADIGQQLPPVSRIVQRVDWDQKALNAVEDIARQLALTSVSGSFEERGRAVRELDARVRHATGVAKARGVAQYVRMLLEAEEPVVLVGWHRDVYDIWLEELKDFNPVLYTGTESAAQKNRAVKAAISGETNLFIMSLRSGAGLDGLQSRFSTIVKGELDWSPGMHQQLIWRLDRDGQTQPVTALYLVADEGSDPVIMEVLGLKAAEAHGINDPHSDPIAPDADTSKLQRLAARYLGRRA